MGVEGVWDCVKLNPSGSTSQHLAWEVTPEGREVPRLEEAKEGEASSLLPPDPPGLTRAAQVPSVARGSREKWQGNNPGGGTHVELLVLPSPKRPQCPTRAAPQEWGGWGGSSVSPL